MKVFVLVAAVVILIFIVLFLNNAPSKARLALSDEAQDIREHYVGNLHSDFIYFLKATTNRQGFETFTKNLELSPSNCNRMDMTTILVLSTNGENISWWNPKQKPDGVYCFMGSTNTSFEVVVYENGSLFFKAMSS